jgi:hypothetical protein
MLASLRSYRIGGIAVFDLILSLVGGYVVGSYFGYNPWVTAVLSIPFGEMVHNIFQIETPGLRMIEKYL